MCPETELSQLAVGSSLCRGENTWRRSTAKAGEEAGLGREDWEGVLDGGKGIELFYSLQPALYGETQPGRAGILS